MSNPNRMSLAGPPQRMQSNPSSSNPSSQQMSSQSNSQGNRRRTTTQLMASSNGGSGMGGQMGNPGFRGSLAGGGRMDAGFGTGQTPRKGNSSLKQSSIYGGAGGSNNGGGGGGGGGGRQSIINTLTPNTARLHTSSLSHPPPLTTRDTRPLKDKTYQQTCRDLILSYFHRNPRAPQITTKSLTSPTQVEFQQMFKFLVQNVLDEDYVFGRGGKKFEEECILILKDHRYPSLDGLSRTGITAPGGPQWPTLLAMLAWLVDLSQVKESWVECSLYEDPDLLPSDRIPLDAENLELLWSYEYASAKYARWIEGGEDFEEEDAIMSENFARKHQAWQDEVNRLEGELPRLIEERDILNSTPSPLIKLEQDYLLYESDKKKFIQCIQHHSKRKEKREEDNVALLDRITAAQNELADLRARKANVDARVRAQGLSMEEVQQMNTEHRTLTASLEDLREKSTHARNEAGSKEMAVARHFDMLEALCQEYSSTNFRLGLLPETPFEFNEFDFTLEVDVAGTTPESILSVNPKTSRQGLYVFLKAMRDETALLEGKIIQTDDELDRVNQAVVQLKEEVDLQTRQLKNTSDQTEIARNTMAGESAEFSRQQQAINEEIAQAQATNRQALLLAESNVESLKIEHSRLVHRTNKLKDDTLEAIIEQTDFIIKFKELTGEALEGLKKFAELN